jgi:hypothetical protein
MAKVVAENSSVLALLSMFEGPRKAYAGLAAVVYTLNPEEMLFKACRAEVALLRKTADAAGLSTHDRSLNSLSKVLLPLVQPSGSTAL